MIEGVRIINKDVLTGLLDLEDASVQTCVTSPPYWGLRDYETGTWIGGDKDCSHVRDTKRSDHTNTGHRNNPMVADAIYKTVCKRCGAKREDLQLGLEEHPDEYISQMVVVFREVRRVLKDDGTLWLNMGDTYCGTGHKGNSKDPKHPNGRNSQSFALNNKIVGLKSKDMVGIPWLLAFALRSDGWYLRQDIIWNKPNCMPEPVKDRCTSSHEYIFLLSKKNIYYFDHEAMKEPAVYAGNKRGDRADSRRGTSMKSINTNTGKYRNKRTVWNINTQPYPDTHFAVFPPELPRICILAGSKEGDIVLDPFWGTGTTGVVAREHGRHAIGIELNRKYVEMSMERFRQQHLNFGGSNG